MQITCGILLTNGTKLLICHPTNHTVWDLPKGRRDQGEENIDAAIRELWEETNLTVLPEQLELIGTFPYKINKDLCLYWYKVSEMPDLNTCYCVSIFEFRGKLIPEMDDYAMVSYATALKKFNPDLRRILKPILFPKRTKR